MGIPSERIERAHQVNILAVAQRYTKLKRAGGGEYCGPCPVCGGRDRFSINTNKQIWNCRGCKKGGDVITLLERVTGRTFTEAVEMLTGETWPRQNSSERARREYRENGSSNVNAAGRIWRAARPIKRTPGERYLERVRGIDVGQIPDIDEVLRFHAACPFGEDAAADCLVALVRDVISDEPKAIVRTALASDDRKIDRKALGPTGNGAIKLWPNDRVTAGLVVGEGMETVAAAATRIVYRGTLLQPAWALIFAANLENFPVLPGVEALTILVDEDETHRGENAANECTHRWLGAGRDVEQLIPRIVGTDFNDIAVVGGVQ